MFIWLHCTSSGALPNNVIDLAAGPSSNCNSKLLPLPQ